MRKIMYVAITAAAVMMVFCMFNKEGRLSRAVENTVDRVGTAIEEKSLPNLPLVIKKEMLEQRERDNREWTAENINKHPDLYLAHCGKLLIHFQEQFGAALLEVNTTINLYRRELSDAQEASVPLLGFLKEAKKALADTSCKYPAKVGLFTYRDAEDLKASVLATDEKLSENERLVQTRQTQLEQLQKMHADLVKGQNRVKSELREHDGRVMQAKAKDLEKAVDGLNARMSALLSSIDALPGKGGALVGSVSEVSTTNNIEDVFSRRGIK